MARCCSQSSREGSRTGATGRSGPQAWVDISRATNRSRRRMMSRSVRPSVSRLRRQVRVGGRLCAGARSRCGGGRRSPADCRPGSGGGGSSCHSRPGRGTCRTAWRRRPRPGCAPDWRRPEIGIPATVPVAMPQAAFRAGAQAVVAVVVVSRAPSCSLLSASRAGRRRAGAGKATLVEAVVEVTGPGRRAAGWRISAVRPVRRSSCPRRTAGAFKGQGLERDHRLRPALHGSIAHDLEPAHRLDDAGRALRARPWPGRQARRGRRSPRQADRSCRAGGAAGGWGG